MGCSRVRMETCRSRSAIRHTGGHHGGRDEEEPFMETTSRERRGRAAAALATLAGAEFLGGVAGAVAMSVARVDAPAAVEELADFDATVRIAAAARPRAGCRGRGPPSRTVLSLPTVAS